MRVTKHGAGCRLWAFVLPLLLLLTACGSGKADATPTPGVEAIYTAAFQTFTAQHATQLAMTPPTNTPAPTATATLAPPPTVIPSLVFATSTTGAGAKGCDSSAFVKDVTIPDNTVVDPGKKFTKTWTLLNNGTCTWDTTYKLAFDSGDQMSGANTALTNSVPPGAVIDISVAMVAPSSNGTYKGIWRMQNGSSQAFGDTPWVIIKVGAGSTATSGPSPTAGPSPTGGVGTYTISGSLGVSGATIEFDTINAVPTVTYSGNNYSFDVPYGWSGTITPKKGNVGKWTFTPASKTFTNVSKDMTQDFVAESVDATATP